MIAHRRLLSRRGLLLGAGAALALPLFRRTRSALAESYPTRLVVWFTPQEPIDKAHWLPGPGFALTEVMSPLEPHKDKLLMVGDMTVASAESELKAGHNLIGNILTGRTNKYFGQPFQFYASGISVDQYVAKALGVQPLTIGVNTGSTFGTSRLSYTAADQPVHPENDPQKAFDSIFANFLVPPDELDELRAKRKSVLDVASAHLSGLEGKLPQEDRHKIERHIEQIAVLESKLAGGSGPIACVPQAPGAVGFSNAEIPERTRRQVDVAVQALACDVTRVATIQIGTSGGIGTPQWPEEGIDVNKNDHDIAHEYYSMGGAQEIADREALERYHYKQFAYLLAAMDDVEEGDGTLLDHSLVLWVKCMSHGHAHSKMMLMLAGSANGQLQTGRFESFPGRPTSDLLVTVCNLMGLPDESFGDPAFCTGALPV